MTVGGRCRMAVAPIRNTAVKTAAPSGLWMLRHRSTDPLTSTVIH